ncbi:MAG TPA: HAMP domain-containing protein [candidate division Zixibacteria bacterium]|nr:HAMP domain-containing protein [candidate division Zixibacteria bacterium]
MGLFTKAVKESQFSFDAKEEKVGEIKDYVRETLEGTPFSEKELTGILLAIEEACTNVIRHAYLYAPGGTIRLKITLTSDKAVFEIIDTGRAFDFEGSGTPDLDRYVETSRKGGLGIYLIRKIMDDVDYRARRNENRLILVKNFPKRTAARRALRGEGISIRKKFAFWMTLILTGLVFIIYFYFENRTTTALRSNFRTQMEEVATTVASQAKDEIVNEARDAEFLLMVRNFRHQNKNIAYISITDKDGEVLAHSEDISLLHSKYQLPPGIISELTTVPQQVNSGGRDILHYILPVTENGELLGHAHIGFSTANLKADIRSSRQGIFIISIISYVLALMAVTLLSNYFVKPIQKLTDGVKKIGSGDLEAKLPIDGADEFSEIARAFNEMTGKIKEAQKNIVEQERLHKEMQVAQEIQHTLLPKHFPDIEGYDIATIYRAAKDVGGDYFDFVWVDENTLGIVVADVSGKGVPGSLVMTMIRTAIRLEARGNRSAVDILSRVNDFVTEDVKKGMFITIFLVVLDSINRKISFASAGHNPMVLYRHDEEKTYFLNPRGIPLGIRLPEELTFGESLEAESIKLKKDDILVVYTDGITEAMNHRREQFGMTRFIQFIRNYSFLTPEDFVEKLNEEIIEFTEGAEQNDDITLVAIKEKVMADEYLVQRRKKLLNLVEAEGKTVKDACQEMKVSTSTYYKYKKRYELYGEEGLKNKEPRGDAMPRQLSYEERSKLLQLIRQFPEYGTTRLKKELESGDYGDIRVDEKALYEELVRLRLNTRMLRLEYSARTGKGLTEDQKELLAKESEKYQEKIARDKQEYLEKLEAASGETGNGKGKVAQFIDNLASAGIPQDEIKDMMDMFSDLEEEIDEDTALKLLERMSNRVTQIKLDMSTDKVLDQSRFHGQDLTGWKKVADDGIDLNLLDNEEETTSFTSGKPAKRLDEDEDSNHD